MTTTVFLIVILAAVIHAIWNAMVKASDDKAAAMTGLVLGHMPFALAALLFVPLPNNASVPYILGGALLHVGYQLFLQSSYRHGDLTQVYPIARGSAPLLTAAVSVAWLGEELSRSAWVGILLISMGLLSLVAVRRADGGWDNRAATLALATGAFTAGYSLVDGIGARVAGTAVGFYALLSLVNGLITGLLMETRYPGIVGRVIRQLKLRSLMAGGASFVAFSMVVWAFTQAPIALVAALRETSVIFAMVLGVFFLKERFDFRRFVATMATATGALAIKLAK